MDTEELHQTYRYLRSIAAQYPNGIPRRFLEEIAVADVSTAAAASVETVETEAEAHADTPVSCTVCMLVSVADSLQAAAIESGDGIIGELVHKIVEQGLKLPAETVRIVPVAEGMSGTDTRFSAAQIDAIVTNTAARVWMALGSAAADSLKQSRSDWSLAPGNWNTFAGSPALVTHDIREISQSASIKREFWGHLKSVLARVSEVKR